jgi:hypothetical protein
MKDRSGAKRDSRPRAKKGERVQNRDQEQPGPVYGLTMRPRRRLFIVLCVIFAAWLVFLLVMYRLSK